MTAKVHPDGDRVLTADVGHTRLRWIRMGDQPKTGWHFVSEDEYHAFVESTADKITDAIVEKWARRNATSCTLGPGATCHTRGNPRIGRRTMADSTERKYFVVGSPDAPPEALPTYIETSDGAFMSIEYASEQQILADVERREQRGELYVAQKLRAYASSRP